MKLGHKELKERYQEYRERARDLYGSLTEVDGKTIVSVVIPHDSAVHMVEDGAFVEAVVWVPISKLKPL